MNPALTPQSLDTLVANLRERASVAVDSAGALVPALEKRLSALGLEAEATPRAETARAGAQLVNALVHTASPENVIDRFATQDLPSSEAALGKSIASSSAVLTALADPQWAVVDLVAERASRGEQPFQRIVDELSRALAHDEFAEPLAPALANAAQRGLALLRAPDPPPPPPPPSPPDTPGLVTTQGDLSNVDPATAQAQIAQLADVDGEVRIDLRWTITTRDERA